MMDPIMQQDEINVDTVGDCCFLEEPNKPMELVRASSLQKSLGCCKPFSAPVIPEKELSTDAPDDTATAATVGTDESSLSLETEASSSDDRAVKFGEVQIRLYPVEPSDNPSVTGRGCAMALGGWNYAMQPALSIDTFEDHHRRRKIRSKMRLGMIERQQLLLEHGASRQQLKDSALQVFQGKKERADTALQLKKKGAVEEPARKKGFKALFQRKEKEPTKEETEELMKLAELLDLAQVNKETNAKSTLACLDSA